MTDRTQPTPDDVADVEEMSTLIEDFILDQVDGMDLRIAMSALISSTLTVMNTKIETKEEAKIYSAMFVLMLEKAFL